MKILIFSDSHGFDRNMKKAISLHPDAEVIVHLGDGVSEFEALRLADPGRAYVPVRGNCDLFLSGEPKETTLDLDGVRLFLTHGAGDSVVSLSEKARAKNADAALFGHTHCRFDSYIRDEGEEKGVHLFNPGSISRPRDGVIPSFGILSIRNKQMLFSHGNV